MEGNTDSPIRLGWKLVDALHTGFLEHALPPPQISCAYGGALTLGEDGAPQLLSVHRVGIAARRFLRSAQPLFFMDVYHWQGTRHIGATLTVAPGRALERVAQTQACLDGLLWHARDTRSTLYVAPQTADEHFLIRTAQHGQFTYRYDAGAFVARQSGTPPPAVGGDPLFL